MKQCVQKIWIKLFWAAARRLPWTTRRIVGAWTITEISAAKTQVTLIVWDLTNPKWDVAYSREELVEMLGVIRKCEREMRWKVPEPLLVPHPISCRCRMCI